MKPSLLVAAAVVAGCGRTPAPACPTPVTAAPVAEAVEEPPAEEPRGESLSADGLYACSRPGGNLEVTMRENFTAKDLVVTYIGITCANVLLPTELAERRYKGAFHGRLKSVEIEPRFRALFEEMGLALVRERGAAIVVDQAWLAPRPGLVLLQRVDPSTMLLSSSPSIPPPLDAAPPPPPTLDGITRIADTHHVVTRATVNDHVAAGGKPARVMPSVKNGQPNGAKLYAIRPTSLYAGLGLRNGDTVHSINGAPVTDVSALALDRLLAPSRVELAITRRGKPETVVIEVRD